MAAKTSGRVTLSPRAKAAVAVVAVALFSVSTLVAVRQLRTPRIDRDLPPKGLEWFLNPRNPPMSGWRVGPDLRAIYALRDNRHIWAAGDLARLSQSRVRFVSERAVNIVQSAPVWLDERTSTLSGARFADASHNTKAWWQRFGCMHASPERPWKPSGATASAGTEAPG
jgi:hypothetical protein